MNVIRVKIIGAEDTLQKKLFHNVQAAVHGLNIEPRIVTITDWEDILNYNIIQTPALMIRNQVVSQGFVPSVSDITKIFKAFLPEKHLPIT
jgi:hypothetical protein